MDLEPRLDPPRAHARNDRLALLQGAPRYGGRGAYFLLVSSRHLPRETALMIARLRAAPNRGAAGQGPAQPR